MKKFEDFADGLPSTVNKTPRNVHPLEQAEKLFKNALLNLQTLQRPQDRPIELRASGLPFCPIKSFLLDNRNASYSMDHYVSTGTEIHNTLQKWLPLGDYQHLIFGNWECTSCGKMKKFTCKPKDSCSCGSNSAEWRYKEVEIKYKNLTGHIDLILKIGKKYIIVDFKSTDMMTKRSKISWDPSQPSSRNYIIQVRTYCTVLTLEYDIPVVGWLLPSINRAQPIRNELDFHMLSGEWSERKSIKWLKFLNAANTDYAVLQRLLRNIKDNDTQAANQSLKKMVTTRPCHSTADYDQWMHYAFYGDAVCPMKDVCTKKSDKAVLGTIRQRLREKV